MINESKNEDIDFQSDCYSINYFNVGRHCGFIHLDPGYLNMKIGKVPENVLKRSVFKQIKFKREEVLIHPGVGEDCAVLELAPDEVFVLSTDPITGAVSDIGTLAVHVTANDLASAGAEPVGLLLTILLPPDAEEADLKSLMRELESACASLNIEIIGGHTEVTPVVNQPVVTVTGVGKVKKDQVIFTKGALPGQDIVVTKWVGLEGTAIIAAGKEKLLKEHYSQDFVDRAKGFLEHISVVKEAMAARDFGVSSMHDITEGGIFGALWEVAAAGGVGLTVDLKRFRCGRRQWRSVNILISILISLFPAVPCLLHVTEDTIWWNIWPNAIFTVLLSVNLQIIMIRSLFMMKGRHVISNRRRRMSYTR